MKLKINGVEYPAFDINEVEIDHLIRMQEETGIGEATLGRRMGAQMAAVENYQAELAIAEKEKKPGPDQPDSDMKIMAIVMWLTRLSAGEDVTFAESRKTRMSAIEWVPEEGDDSAVAELVNPTKPAVKRNAGSEKPKRPLAAAG